MRTAETIAQQQESQTAISKKNSKPRSDKAPQLRPYQFQPGQSGNPAGRPKADISRQIAKRIFENNEEGAYAALGKALLKGNAYVFKELAERAYGKLPQRVEMGVSEDLVARLVAGRKRLKKDS
jgi:hypothetical protein